MTYSTSCETTESGLRLLKSHLTKLLNLFTSVQLYWLLKTWNNSVQPSFIWIIFVGFLYILKYSPEMSLKDISQSSDPLKPWK